MLNWLFGKKQEQEQKPLSYLTLLSTPLVSGDKNDSTIISRLEKKHPEWSKPYIETLIRQYKRFLHTAANSDSELVPTKDVDEVWHEHILFTKDYFVNWKEYLGRLVHHNPEKLGENKDYSESFKKTQKTLETILKEKPILDNKPKKETKKTKLVSRKETTPTVYSTSPSYSSPVIDPVDCFLLTNTILESNQHDCAPASHGHSEASHCSSSSSCSSSSCSSSSCGGGGGD